MTRPPASELANSSKLLPISRETEASAAHLISRGKAPEALRAAAGRVRRAVEQFDRHEFPWCAVVDPDNGDGDRYQLRTMPVPIEGAGVALDGYRAEDLAENTAAYLAMLGPQIAGSLTALLIDVARNPKSVPHNVVMHATALAVELLHEEDTDV